MKNDQANDSIHNEPSNQAVGTNSIVKSTRQDRIGSVSFTLTPENDSRIAAIVKNGLPQDKKKAQISIQPSENKVNEKGD